MRYAVGIRPVALKDFKHLPRDRARQIYRAIQQLRENPLPQNSLKLKGVEFHRLRIGKYRVVYAIHHDRRQIEIARIGHRKDIYRLLKDLL